MVTDHRWCQNVITILVTHSAAFSFCHVSSTFFCSRLHIFVWNYLWRTYFECFACQTSRFVIDWKDQYVKRWNYHSKTTKQVFGIIRIEEFDLICNIILIFFWQVSLYASELFSVVNFLKGSEEAFNYLFLLNPNQSDYSIYTKDQFYSQVRHTVRQVSLEFFSGTLCEIYNDLACDQGFELWWDLPILTLFVSVCCLVG